MNKGAKIMVVEDDASMRFTISRILEREGYLVIESDNARDALAMIERDAVALVITDIIMPETDGVELMFSLRRTHPEIPVLAMSGGGRCSPDFHLKLAARAGAVQILSKPFDPTELLARVAAC